MNSQFLTTRRCIAFCIPKTLGSLYIGCKLHPGVGFWSGALLCGAPPFFYARVPLLGFTPTTLPGERQWVGHFLAALIRRVANIAGNFIRPLWLSSIIIDVPTRYICYSPLFRSTTDELKVWFESIEINIYWQLKLFNS